MSITTDEFINCFWTSFNKVNGNNHSLLEFFKENGQKLSDLSREQIHELALRAYQASCADVFIIVLGNLSLIYSPGLTNLYNEIIRLKNPSVMLTELNNKLKKIKTEQEKFKSNLESLKVVEDSVFEQIIIQKFKLSMEQERNKSDEHEKLKSRRELLENEIAKIKELEKAYL